MQDVSNSAPTMVLLEEDDFMHPVEDVSNFNESAYYNFINHTEPTVGGWLRLGNRPNESYAEMTVCLYEPDGGIAFNFARAPISDNRAHDAGGARFEVIKPWGEHRATYRGSVCVMRNPLDLSNPSVAFKSNPHEAADVDIHWFGLSPGSGGEMRRRAGDGAWRSVGADEPANQFARGHFEQAGAVRGHIGIGARRYQIDGYGFRDHSWGPRYWQNTDPYQWLLMNFGGDCGLMLFRSESAAGVVKSHGFLWEKGKPNRTIGRVEIETEYKGPDAIHDKIDTRFWVEGNDVPMHAVGQVITPAPCRNRRAGWITRVTEGLTRWRMGDRVGYGISEYLAHLETGATG